MLGVGGVFEDGGSSPVDSVVVEALQRGQWSPGDLLSRLYHSLQAFAVQSISAAVPDGDTTAQQCNCKNFWGSQGTFGVGISWHLTIQIDSFSEVNDSILNWLSMHPNAIIFCVHFHAWCKIIIIIIKSEFANHVLLLWWSLTLELPRRSFWPFSNLYVQ